MSSATQPSSEQVTSELRRRLEEAEETLRAIRDGEVDALVMRNPADEDEVFTLEGGTESYRAFMEAMEIGAAAFDASGRLIYANRALIELLGASADISDTDHLFARLPLADRDVVARLVQSAQLARSTDQISLTGDGGVRHVQLSAAPLTLGLSRGVALTFTDITSRVEALEAQESERAAHAIIASANEAVIVCDLDGIVTHANAAVSAICAANPVGRPFEDAITILAADAPGLLQGNAFIELAISGVSVQGVEAHAPHAPRIRDLLISAAPLKLGAKITGCVVTMVDLSQRKAAEKQQLLLMGELDHRVKNTLALVLSIAKRTSSTEGTVEAFQKAFSSRIQALAATHNILADRSWNSVSIAEIVRTELEPYIDDAQHRLDVTGEPVKISPRAAIALGMIIHELATNAVKYGALSAATGRIAVEVSLDAEGRVALHWNEHGGPQVSKPTRSGFGQTVITRSMQYSPDGGADIQYLASGVRCDIRIPEADVEPVG